MFIDRDSLTVMNILF